MKSFSFTILCLTVITVAGFFTDYGGTALLLWIFYGLYKLFLFEGGDEEDEEDEEADVKVW